MKILLNLLPDEKKQVAEQRMHFRFLVWQIFLLSSLEVFFLGILIVIFTLLDFERKQQELLGHDFNRYHEEEKKLKLYEAKFRTMNDQVKVTALINKNHFVFTNIFLLLDRHVGDTIMLEHIETKEFQLFLSGIAETRDDLVVFSEALKKEECFSAVNLPLANFLLQKNISFQFDITLKESCLHNTTDL
ncbi:MAG: hypothetical protein KA054_00340 [Candidatus Moranbacteria bacterium]|nr:hypothetical protein [Candidatus Moranbacteria bacterium]